MSEDGRETSISQSENQKFTNHSVINPLGTMNVCAKFPGSPSSRLNTAVEPKGRTRPSRATLPAARPEKVVVPAALFPTASKS